MTKGRKPDPDQLALVPDPSKSEDKRLVRLVDHAMVVEFCNCEHAPAPTASQWRNAQEVLTFLIHRRTDTGIQSTTADIAGSAFHPETRSESLVERTLRLLRGLGIVSTQRLGDATAFEIRFGRLAEMRAKPPVANPSSTRQPTRQTAIAMTGEIRVDDGSMTAGIRVDDGSDDGSDYSPPFPFQEPIPTTTSDDGSRRAADDGAAWAVVVEEVRGCGVSQAVAAVEAARQRNATIGDVRAIVAAWGERRAGWRHAPVNLFRRLRWFDPNLSPANGWPPFDDAHQAQLDREARELQRRDELDRRAARRRAYVDERERARREWAEAGLSIVAMAEAADPAFAAGIRAATNRRAGRSLTDEEHREASPRPP